jgi:hypothetical protein
MRLKSAYKFIFSSFIVLIFACTQIDRDNLLDPKNPSSKRESVLLLEAFINTNRSAPNYNFLALEAIDSLSEIYGDRLIWVEYHWNTTNPQYVDDLSVVGVEDLYDDYAVTKGIPDLFVNGSSNRVQGASSINNVIRRVQEIASDLIIKSSKYSLEAEIEQTGNQLNGTYRVARLGNERSDEMLLRIVISGNTGPTGKRCVRKIEFPINIGEIDPGEFLEDEFSINTLPENADKAVFILKDKSDLNVLYAIEKDLL